MTIQLKRREWFDVTRKVWAGAVTALIMPPVIALLNRAAPGLGDALGPEIQGFLIALAPIAVAYLTTDRA